MANTLRFKRGLASGIPTGVAGEPLFTTDTFDLYIGNGTTNTRFQKYIASGTTSQYLRGDGSLATFPSLTGFVPYTGATANVDLGVYTILAQNATIASSGSGNTATITHSSGSGIALNITKGGNGEGLYINKTSGTGNAATIIGTLNATTLVKSGGLSTEYLKADGSVSTLTNPITGTGANGRVAFWTGTNTQSSNSNLFWDNTNSRLGIGFAGPSTGFDLRGTSNTAASTIQIVGNSISSLLLGQNANGGVIRGQGGTDVLSFWNGGLGDTGAGQSGTERMRLTTLGNLHIGTFSSDSGEELQVTGDMKVTGASSFGGALTVTDGDITVATFGSFSFLNSSRNFIPNSSGILLGGLRYRGYSTGTTYQTGSQILSFSSVGWTSTSTPAYLSFQTTTAGSTSPSEKMQLDASGNLGLGVTPSAFFGTVRAMQIGLLGAFSSRTGGNGTYFSSNVYFTADPSDSASNANYIAGTSASAYMTGSGSHKWFIAPSGSANAAITFTQAMTLTANGRLLLGTTTEGTDLLEVNGTAKITGATNIGGFVTNTNGGFRTSAQQGYLLRNDANSGNLGGIVRKRFWIGSGTDNSPVIIAETGLTLDFFVDGSTKGLSLATSGAATFSSSVTVATNLVLNGTSIEQNNASGLTLNASNASGAILFRTAGSERASISNTGYTTITNTGGGSFSSQLNLVNSTSSPSLISFSNTINSFAFGFNSTTTQRFVFINSASSEIASISSTGEATFSSSVTAASATITGNLTVDSSTFFVDATANEVGIGTNAPNSSLHVVGSITKSIIAKTANYTATVSDYTILCDTTGGGFTITLPASSGITGRIYVIKKTNASSGVGNVTIDGNGSETIDGAATIALQCKSSVMLQCDGSNWHILSLYSDTSCI